jgi:hypothetical protein
MPKNAAIKNAARERQAQTGETYTEARAAVVAEHDATDLTDLEVYLDDAESLSWVTHTTVTPEQLRWMGQNAPELAGRNLGPQPPEEFLSCLPAELATSAILERYAAAIWPGTERHLNASWDRMEAVDGANVADALLPRDLLADFICGMDEVDGPVELERVTAIMACASRACDAAVLHQCIDIITAWMHKLADSSVRQ